VAVHLDEKFSLFVETTPGPLTFLPKPVIEPCPESFELILHPYIIFNYDLFYYYRMGITMPLTPPPAPNVGGLGYPEKSRAIPIC
jgi:hypothetical protein